MMKWIVTVNNVKRDFQNEEEAKNYFKKKVIEYLTNSPCNVFNSGEGQFTIEAFFAYLYNIGKIEDNDKKAIEIYHKYFSNIVSSNNEKIENIEYRKENKEFNEKVEIRFDGTLFRADYYGIDNNFVHTNILAEKCKAFYFKSRQVINTVDVKEKELLGKEYNIDIVLLPFINGEKVKIIKEMI